MARQRTQEDGPGLKWHILAGDVSKMRTAQGGKTRRNPVEKETHFQGVERDLRAGATGLYKPHSQRHPDDDGPSKHEQKYAYKPWGPGGQF